MQPRAPYVLLLRHFHERVPELSPSDQRFYKNFQRRGQDSDHKFLLRHGPEALLERIHERLKASPGEASTWGRRVGQSRAEKSDRHDIDEQRVEMEEARNDAERERLERIHAHENARDWNWVIQYVEDEINNRRLTLKEANRKYGRVMANRPTVNLHAANETVRQHLQELHWGLEGDWQAHQYHPTKVENGIGILADGHPYRVDGAYFPKAADLPRTNLLIEASQFLDHKELTKKMRHVDYALKASSAAGWPILHPDANPKEAELLGFYAGHSLREALHTIRKAAVDDQRARVLAQRRGNGERHTLTDMLLQERALGRRGLRAGVLYKDASGQAHFLALKPLVEEFQTLTVTEANKRIAHLTSNPRHIHPYIEF